MSTTRSIRGLALAGLASLGLFASNAHAQNAVDVDIVISGGGIAILNYYSEIDVTIDTAQLADLASPCTVIAGIANCDEGASGNLSATAGGGNLNADGAITAAGGDDLTAVNLDLANVWAVRAIGGGANTTVTVALGTGTSLTNGAGTIGINSALVFSDSVATPAASVQFPDPGLAAANAERGGIRLELDLSDATVVGGTYSAAAATYTITVNNT